MRLGLMHLPTGSSGPAHPQRIRLPIVARLLIANGLVVVVGASLGTTLTKILVDASAFELAVAFTLGGVTLSLLLNYLILRVALRPLSSLTSTVDGIHEGNTTLRAPSLTNQDPDIARLASALNAMLERLAAHTATIEANREQLRALSSQVITAQEEERKRIARELHDETSQSLASLLIALERIDSAMPAEMSDLKARLAAARTLAAETLGGVRGLVADLRPLLLDDLGLIPAIRWYARQHLEPEGIDVDYDFRCESPRLPPPVETALFRIAQEAINNVVRHADAAQVRIAFGCDTPPDCPRGRAGCQRGMDCPLECVRRRLNCEGTVRLIVEDDGVGFQTSGEADRRGRFGLFGIRERAAALGGGLELRSTPGLGTYLEVSVPLEKFRSGPAALGGPSFPAGDTP